MFTDRERSGEYLPMRTRLDRPGTSARQGVGAVGCDLDDLTPVQPTLE
ncbi:hypothetical protein ACFXG4_22255 [Nocardia sp. NPDC059246]